MTVATMHTVFNYDCTPRFLHSYVLTTSRYTGKERDAESGLDYFGARYYGSSMGRFMSPDWNSEPEAIPFADLRNPQSLNLYAYVNNNPLRMADPDGHDGEDDEDDEGDPQAAATVVAAPTAAATAEETGFAIISGPTVLLTGAGIGVAMLFPKHLANGDLPLDSNGNPIVPANSLAPQPQPQADHTKDARPSTKGKHQKGQGRKKKDKGGEKGDKRRQQNGMFPRKPPGGNNPKGGWPPKNFNEFVPIPVPPPDKPKKDTHGDG